MSNNFPVYAKITKPEMDKLGSLCIDIVGKTGKKVSEILRQACFFAIQSASKATAPGNSWTISGMASKYKHRPKKSMSSFDGWYWYKYYDRNGDVQTFRSKNNISNSGKMSRPQKIKQGLLKFKKKQKVLAWIPNFGTPKYLKIPNAGAAKGGWIGALRRLGKSAQPNPEGYSLDRLSMLEQNYYGLNQYVSVTNLVKYTPITSPGSAQRGVEAAEARMRHIYFPQLEKEIGAMAR